MSFGEFKNNFFATLALVVVFGICFTITAFIGSEIVLLIILAVLWALIFPATYTFMYVFFVYDGMTAIIRDRDEMSRDLTNSIEKSIAEHKDKQAARDLEEDFSDIDIASLKDTDDYIFHNGRMVKQSTILRMIRERESQTDSSDQKE